MEGEDGGTACVGGSMESHVEETMRCLNTVFLEDDRERERARELHTRAHMNIQALIHTVNILLHTHM